MVKYKFVFPTIFESAFFKNILGIFSPVIAYFNIKNRMNIFPTIKQEIIAPFFLILLNERRVFGRILLFLFRKVYLKLLKSFLFLIPSLNLLITFILIKSFKKINYLAQTSCKNKQNHTKILGWKFFLLRKFL